jgi:hypothetical protein
MPACRQIGFVLTGRKVLAVLMTLMIVGAAIAALPTRAGDVAPAVLDAQQHRIDVMRRASAAADGPASSRRSLCWTAGSPRHSTDGSRYPQKPIAANLSVRNDGNAEDAEGGRGVCFSHLLHLFLCFEDLAGDEYADQPLRRPIEPSGGVGESAEGDNV